MLGLRLPAIRTGHVRFMMQASAIYLDTDARTAYIPDLFNSKKNSNFYLSPPESRHKLYSVVPHVNRSRPDVHVDVGAYAPDSP